MMNRRFWFRRQMYKSSDGSNAKNKIESTFRHWKARIEANIKTVQHEWQRTEFFKDGGAHAIKHNIRYRHEYAIPKKYVVLPIAVFLVLLAINLYPGKESNIYLKKLKEERNSKRLE